MGDKMPAVRRIVLVLLLALNVPLLLGAAPSAWPQATTTTPAPKKKATPAKPKTAPAPEIVQPAPQPQPGKPVNPAEEAEAKRYLACLDNAKRTPAIGLQAAEVWRNQSGGAPALHCAAVALFELKRYQEAALRFESLADASPKPQVRFGALEQSAQAWFLAGHPDMAERQIGAALKLKPGDPELLIDRGIFRANGGRLKEAIEDWSQALAASPDRDDVLALRATALRRTNQLAAARADADRAVAINPKNPDALLERGTIRQLEGDTGGAMEDWRQVQSVAPDSVAAQTATENLARATAAPTK